MTRSSTGAPAARPRGRMPAPLRTASIRIRQALPAILSVAAALAAWEIYVLVSGISALVLPAPSRVIGQIVANRELLWTNTLPTLQATLTGFAFSLTLAFTLSVLIDFIPKLRRALFPVFVISQTLPLVAIAPLVVLWFGFGLTPKILLVALVTFFPMLIALVDGYESTEPEIEALLASMGALPAYESRSPMQWWRRFSPNMSVPVPASASSSSTPRTASGRT